MDLIFKTVLGSLPLLIPSLMISGCTLQTESIGNDGWPILPVHGFIRGRPARDSDIAKGNALFISNIKGDFTAHSVDILIPQYAYVTERDDTITKVVIIQAESNALGTFLGVEDANGHRRIVSRGDVQFVGTHRP